MLGLVQRILVVSKRKTVDCNNLPYKLNTFIIYLNNLTALWNFVYLYLINVIINQF